MSAPKRQRGEIETLPSGSLRVRVYAGIDPVTKKKHYLAEVIPAGPRAARDAEKTRTRLLAQVDERRNPRTRATMNQLLDRWLEVLDVDVSTRRGYISKIETHIRPLLGMTPVSKVDVEALESFYAVLRRCRKHCVGRKSAGHECRGLADSTVRQIHWIVSGAFDAAVRWKWVSLNSAAQAKKPPVPRPNPKPPSAEESAKLVTEAWKDDDWGTFVWAAMTTGARRGELCAIHWCDLDLDHGVLLLRRALYMDRGELLEKDTKTHQQRRVALDEETVDVFVGHREGRQKQFRDLGLEWNNDAYVFTLEPDGSKPLHPDTATQRFDRMATRLGIVSTLHSLRHYSATELIAAGVDVRTVAGRLGHSGGGATTLRVYAAWLSEADQRAAATLSARMPARPRKAGTPD
jgi:integrase